MRDALMIYFNGEKNAGLVLAGAGIAIIAAAAVLFRARSDFRALAVTLGLLALMWKDRPGASGVALGLLISAAFLLAFDIIAERRGAAYLQALQALRTSSGPPRV